MPDLLIPTTTIVPTIIRLPAPAPAPAPASSNLDEISDYSTFPNSTCFQVVREDSFTLTHTHTLFAPFQFFCVNFTFDSKTHLYSFILIVRSVRHH
jgi:hypothetical protein